ncbi:interleukin-12 receptor subunit beta-2 [Patagioenas fasciata monilis]|uniref:Interleukin-12 receptor subunit beta-2 n=1 Tax=Patagioenas fasciata monilis TaxID=372326 RepID=A0A1V4JXM4_PATFA|nr:interleukin-12 receptor subunit beta-2 [Patagioenas fasciata monilis]
MLFACVVLTAVWLLVHITAEGCGRGNAPASKPPHGAAEICDKGNMTINTSPHVQPGTNIILSCQLNRHTEQCRIAIFFNSFELINNYSSSVSTEFQVRAYGKHMFTCKIVCEHKRKLVCGIDVESGNPPEEPRNVSCIQYETDGHPTCTWDKGRLTYISTKYVLQLSNGTDVSCVSEESLNQRFGSLALSKLNFDSTYTLVVAASNELGSVFSQPLAFTLIDIVKPHPPNFSVEFDNSSTSSCSFIWHSDMRGRHCRLRYRPLTSHTWSMVESLTSEKCNLGGLEPHTTYEFQVSCKMHPERGLWSSWRGYRTQTPEAAPTGILDIWYRQQDLDSQRQNISVFWKALSASEARGRILGYTVTFEALGQRSPPAGEVHLTTQTSYARVTPREGYKVTVTAENSRGRSPPTSIITNLGTQDLPPPQQVSAVAAGNSSILVSWKAPASPSVPIGGYVVEWAEMQRDPRPAWVRLPASNLSTVITEHIKDNVCYQISVFALYRDRAGQAASVWGYSRAEAPSAGPQMYTTPHANGIFASWEAIGAQQQAGCTPGYHMYLQKGDGQGPPDIYGSGDWMAIVLTCSFFIFSACVCSVPPARKLLHSLLSAVMPQWQSKAIPDPANATWAKKYISVKAELSLSSSLFLPSVSSFEEPEITHVEEAFTKTGPPALGDKFFGTVGTGDGSPAGGVGQEEMGYGAVPSAADGDVSEQQLHDLYQRLVEVTEVTEVTEHTQPVSDYIANPVTSTAPTYPLVTEDQPEIECNPPSIFPTTFLTPIHSYEGNLTLDTVKINCSSFPR